MRVSFRAAAAACFFSTVVAAGPAGTGKTDRRVSLPIISGTTLAKPPRPVVPKLLPQSRADSNLIPEPRVDPQTPPPDGAAPTTGDNGTQPSIVSPKTDVENSDAAGAVLGEDHENRVFHDALHLNWDGGSDPPIYNFALEIEVERARFEREKAALVEQKQFDRKRIADILYRGGRAWSPFRVEWGGKSWTARNAGLDGFAKMWRELPMGAKAAYAQSAVHYLKNLFALAADLKRVQRAAFAVTNLDEAALLEPIASDPFASLDDFERIRRIDRTIDSIPVLIRLSGADIKPEVKAAEERQMVPEEVLSSRRRLLFAGGNNPDGTAVTPFQFNVGGLKIAAPGAGLIAYRYMSEALRIAYGNNVISGDGWHAVAYLSTVLGQVADDPRLGALRDEISLIAGYHQPSAFTDQMLRSALHRAMDATLWHERRGSAIELGDKTHFFNVDFSGRGEYDSTEVGQAAIDAAMSAFWTGNTPVIDVSGIRTYPKPGEGWLSPKGAILLTSAFPAPSFVTELIETMPQAVALQGNLEAIHSQVREILNRLGSNATVYPLISQTGEKRWFGCAVVDGRAKEGYLIVSNPTARELTAAVAMERWGIELDVVVPKHQTKLIIFDPSRGAWDWPIGGIPKPLQTRTIETPRHARVLWEMIARGVRPKAK